MTLSTLHIVKLAIPEGRHRRAKRSVSAMQVVMRMAKLSFLLLRLRQERNRSRRQGTEACRGPRVFTGGTICHLYDSLTLRASMTKA